MFFDLSVYQTVPGSNHYVRFGKQFGVIFERIHSAIRTRFHSISLNAFSGSYVSQALVSSVCKLFCEHFFPRIPFNVNDSGNGHPKRFYFKLSTFSTLKHQKESFFGNVNRQLEASIETLLIESHL